MDEKKKIVSDVFHACQNLRRCILKARELYGVKQYVAWWGMINDFYAQLGEAELVTGELLADISGDKKKKNENDGPKKIGRYGIWKKPE